MIFLPFRRLMRRAEIVLMAYLFHKCISPHFTKCRVPFANENFDGIYHDDLSGAQWLLANRHYNCSIVLHTISSPHLISGRQRYRVIIITTACGRAHTLLLRCSAEMAAVISSLIKASSLALPARKPYSQMHYARTVMALSLGHMAAVANKAISAQHRSEKHLTDIFISRHYFY